MRFCRRTSAAAIVGMARTRGCATSPPRIVFQIGLRTKGKEAVIVVAQGCIKLGFRAAPCSFRPCTAPLDLCGHRVSAVEPSCTLTQRREERRGPTRGSWRGRAVPCTRLTRVSPLLATKRVACMTAFRVMRGSSVSYLDTLLESQLHIPNRLRNPRRLMGDSPYPRTHTGASRGITFSFPGTPPASAGLRNASQAYCRRAEGSFPVLGPLWKVGKQRLALSGEQRTARRAVYEWFPRA
jgi:hypothetical protein